MSDLLLKHFGYSSMQILRNKFGENLLEDCALEL